MGNVIDLFMWGFQQDFQISVRGTAEGLFNAIDPRLKPSVFLLGVLASDIADRHPVCLEPEDCGYSVKAFHEVSKLAEQLEKVDQERNFFHTHPVVQENHNRRISDNAQVEAIQKILYKEDLYGDSEKFVSSPTYIEGFQVYVILEIQKEALNNHYSLTKQKINNRIPINRSFIESAVMVFLKECFIALKDPTKGIGAIERNSEELLRESGRQFMYSISQAGQNYFGLHGLYEACNSISALKYEGGEGLGKMIIAKHEHPNIRLTLELQEPIELRDFRKVRKFLELADDGAMIVSDSKFIFGLGEQRGKYNPKEESLFVINFTSHYKWEVLHDGNAMMVVEYRQPNLPKEKIDRSKFYADLRRIFSNIEKAQLDNLWDITTAATKQTHGTMLVITDDAVAEATRLGKQSFPLKPLKVSANIVQQITAIDGSVLLDRNSFCHAIGVILDGLATPKGDSSRGARFNSAVRYYEYFGKHHPTVIVIISEDGMINLIPDLRPQIKHSTIIEGIERLKQLSETGAQDMKRFNFLMEFFSKVSFYLTETECETINHLRKTIEGSHNLGEVRIIRGDLEPNDEMNESYYLDEN